MRLSLFLFAALLVYNPFLFAEETLRSRDSLIQGALDNYVHLQGVQGNSRDQEIDRALLQCEKGGFLEGGFSRKDQPQGRGSSRNHLITGELDTYVQLQSPSSSERGRGQKIERTLQQYSTRKGVYRKQYTTQDIKKLLSRMSLGRRGLAMEESLNRCEAKSVFTKDLPADKKRDRTIEENLHKVSVSMALEYFPATGYQTFLVGEGGSWTSELVYPRKENIWILNGEVRFLPFLSVGGSCGFAASRGKIGTDTDWLNSFGPDPYHKSEFHSRSWSRLYDINLYLRLFEKKIGAGKPYDVTRSSFSKKYRPQNLIEYVSPQKVSVDLIIGYQKSKGEFKMREGYWLTKYGVPSSDPIPGLDSFYRISYQGPRLGLRGTSDWGRGFRLRGAFTYAWLEADAFGFWNLRNYPFWQHGGHGHGWNFDLAMDYDVSTNLTLSLGYRYLYAISKKGMEAGLADGTTFYEMDIWRKSESKLSGPTFLLRYAW